MSITLFYGKNSYLLRQAVNELRQKFVEGESDLNLNILDAREIEEVEIVTACETPPFLGQQRLVIVRDFDFKRAVPQLVKTCQNLPEHCQLVITAAAVDARTKLFKVLKKHGETHEFAPLLKPAAFSRWLENEATNRELKLQPDALKLLATFTLGNCEAASSELAKLAAYTDGAPITRADVVKLVHPDLHTSVFLLTDAIGERRISAALNSLQDLVNRGENLIQIFFMIVKQFRTLLNLHSLAAENLPPSELARRLKLHPFVVQNSLRQMRNFSANELLLAHRKLLVIDAAVKTGRISAAASNPVEFSLALEKFIVGFG